MAARLTSLNLSKIKRLYLEGLNVTQIAEEMACKEPAVRRNLDKLGLMLINRRFPERHQAPKLVAPPMPMPVVPPRYVERDPCFHCGIRSDLGCEHTRRAA